MIEAVYFASSDEWRAWLARHHAGAEEFWLGFHKVGCGSGLTYRDALDAALAYGWIDAARRSVDEARWQIRFVPRRKGSIWSAVNIRRVGELTALGQMQPAGVKAFKERDPARQNLYSFENRPELSPPHERKFRANRTAWDFFMSQPPSYRRPAIWWVMSAKQDETRERRLAILIADSAAGRKIRHLTRPDERQMG